MCLGRIYSAQKEETVDIRKGPSLRVKKCALIGKFGHSMGSSSGACLGRDGE